jgi:hypothetical protein
MIPSLWRRLWHHNPSLSGGERRGAGLKLGYQPWLEPLEDRLVPAWPGEVLAFGPTPGLISPLPPASSKPPGGTTPIRVVVDQDSPETVLELGTAFGARSGLQQGDGLKLSVLSNTNPALVKTELSEATLTCTYARGKSGTAIVIVAATDGDGVSVRQSVEVTVRPPAVAGVPTVTLTSVGVVTPIPMPSWPGEFIP